MQKFAINPSSSYVISCLCTSCVQAIDCVAGSAGGCMEPTWDHWESDLGSSKFEAHKEQWPYWLIDYPFTSFSMASLHALNSSNKLSHAIKFFVLENE